MIMQELFALGFILIPASLLTSFEVTLIPIATTFVNLFGSSLIGLVFLLWIALKSDNLAVKKTTI